MLIKELFEYLSQGREIEFHLNNVNYFMQPVFECSFQNVYAIYEIQEEPKDNKVLFKGPADDVIRYKFDGKYSFVDDIDKFSFDCIL